MNKETGTDIVDILEHCDKVTYVGTNVHTVSTVRGFVNVGTVTPTLLVLFVPTEDHGFARRYYVYMEYPYTIPVRCQLPEDKRKIQESIERTLEDGTLEELLKMYTML